MVISKRSLLVVGALILAALIFQLRGLLFSEALSDQEQLLALIDEVAAAAEARNLKRVLSRVAESYRDQQGRDRQGLTQLIRATFLMQKQISVYVVNKDVELADLRAAVARVDAVITRGQRVQKLTDIIPESARALRFTLRWVKEGDQWLLQDARWTHIARLQELLR